MGDSVRGKESKDGGEGEGGEEVREEGGETGEKIRGKSTLSKSLKHSTVFWNLCNDQCFH